LILGGLYLCYEGFEKVAHRLLHSAAEDAEHHEELVRQLVNPAVDLVKFEQRKIKGAIRTDFILSAEIIVLTLGIVAESDFVTQVLVVSGIALVMTIGVYGLVAGIVKLDDAGLHLLEREGDGALGRLQRWIGAQLIVFAPWLMKFLAVVGTIAMFMVGGGILLHGIPWLHHVQQFTEQQLQAVATAGPLLAALAPTVLGIVVGMVAGAVVLGMVSIWQRLRGRSA
jgi:hypothetical protein